MADSFEVVQSSSEDELTEEKRHEVVAAQLRGEAKAAGQGPDAVVAAVAAELEDIGLEPDPSELHRRYEEIDPDIPELADAGDAPPADQGTGAATSATPSEAPSTDGPVAAGVDAARDRSPVDDQVPVHDQVPVDDRRPDDSAFDDGAFDDGASDDGASDDRASDDRVPR